MNDLARFAVIQLQRDAHDTAALGRALAAARGTPLQDQMLAARGAWGIVAEKLTGEEAGALAAALTAGGIECAARPMSSLVELPAVEPATKLDDLPNVAPVLIAVAGITVVSTTTTKEKQGPTGAQKIASAALMMTGLPIKVGGRTRTVEKTHESQSLAFYVDLHYENPARRLRIAAAKFDYSCLKERKLFQAQANLKLLMGDLARAAPAAWQSHGTRVLLEGKPISTMGYASLADLDREARWLLTLRRAVD